jgi:hypothetical protein
MLATSVPSETVGFFHFCIKCICFASLPEHDYNYLFIGNSATKAADNSSRAAASYCT